MGFSMRQTRWRYTEWRRWKGAELTADWTAAGLHAKELYDHGNDTGLGAAAFDGFGFVNLAQDGAHQAAAQELAAQLAAHFQGDDTGS